MPQGDAPSRATPNPDARPAPFPVRRPPFVARTATIPPAGGYLVGMRARLSLLALLATIGCQQDPAVPKVTEDPVSITLTVSTRTLKVGQPDTLKVVVKNNLTGAVRIFFSTTCMVFFTVRAQDGTVVSPRDGRPECLPVPSQMNLAQGGTQTFTTIWTGGFAFNPPDTQAKVAPGSYFISAALVASGYLTEAPAYKVDVTQ